MIILYYIIEIYIGAIEIGDQRNVAARSDEESIVRDRLTDVEGTAVYHLLA
jgi:hypothetical protein